MRPTSLLLLFWAFLLVSLGSTHFFVKQNRTREGHTALAKSLLLTDLCLSTESRHTRHLAMPEYFAPFQDFPGYHEHFPSSSFLWTWPAHKTAPDK